MIFVRIALFVVGLFALSGPVKATPSDIVDVRTFGAACNGAGDDASAINSALTYAGTLVGAVVMLPPGGRCVVGSTLNVPAHVTLAAYGWGNGGDLWAKNLNQTVISLNGPFTEVRDLWINSSLAGGTNTSGTAITMGNNQHQMVNHVLITGAFKGLDINGNTVWVDNTVVNDVPANGIGWSVGRLGSGANTLDVRITNSTVGGASTSAAYDQIIYDAGGLQEVNNDLISAVFGTYIYPGAGQAVVWSSFSNTVLGDTNGLGALVIDTSAPTALVAGLQCTGCWVSAQTNAASANILVNNGGGGTISGLHFVGLRNFDSAGHGAYLGAGTEISFDDTHVCGAALGGASGKYDIVVGTNVSNVSINGGQLGSNCDGRGTGAAGGVFLSGGNLNIQISNVNFNGVATPVSGTPLSGSVAVGNYGMLPGTPTIASASTITLNGVYPTYTISGTTGISTISGAWQNRQTTLITTGAISFSTAGNICKAYTSVANVPILATYSGSCWYLK